MFRKIVLSFAFILASVSMAKADRIVDVIGPSTAAVNSSTINSSSATIASPGVGFRNCLTSVVLTGNSNILFSIRGGNIDEFVVDISTPSLFFPSNTGPVRLEWPADDPLCAEYNTTINLVVSTGTAKINYKGQIRTNR